MKYGFQVQQVIYLIILKDLPEIANYWYGYETPEQTIATL